MRTKVRVTKICTVQRELEFELEHEPHWTPEELKHVAELHAINTPPEDYSPGRSVDLTYCVELT